MSAGNSGTGNSGTGNNETKYIDGMISVIAMLCIVVMALVALKGCNRVCEMKERIAESGGVYISNDGVVPSR